jgi:hypothetical protein
MQANSRGAQAFSLRGFDQRQVVVPWSARHWYPPRMGNFA